jgi:hypothetical protein
MAGITGLTADAIRAARDFKIEALEVPAWGGTVFVRSLTLRDARVFQEVSAAAVSGTFNATDMVKIVAVSLCDEGGARLFTDAEIEDLAAKDLDAIRLVFDKAVQVIGLTKGGVEDEKKD